MSFYYTRENGDEGQILVEDGLPPGEPFSQLLDLGPVDVRAALECISYLADILSIAEEDEALHGDLKPGYVFIDDIGSVHLSGYGEERRGGRAPEGRSGTIAADVYGLGLVLISLLTTDSVGAIPREPDAHDELMVEKLRQIDWQELADRKWQEKVLHFLCSMLSFDPDERPEALDVANVLGQASQHLEGHTLAHWAAANLEPSTVGMRPPSIPEEELLSGAHRLGTTSVPQTQQKPRQAASSKGESTAFWSREKIDQMLHESSLDAGPARYTAPDAERSQESKARVPPDIPELPDATLSASSATVEAIKAEIRSRRPPQPGAAPVVPPPPGPGLPPLAQAPIAPPLAEKPSPPPRPIETGPPAAPPISGPVASRPPVVAPVSTPSAPPVARRSTSATGPDGPAGAHRAAQGGSNMVLILGIGVGLMLVLGGGLGLLLGTAPWEKSTSRDRDRDEDDASKDDPESSEKSESASEASDESAEGAEASSVDGGQAVAADGQASGGSSSSGSSGSGGRSTQGGRSGGGSSGTAVTTSTESAELAVIDSTIGVAEVSLTFAGADAAYFCTPGEVNGEFNSKVVFQLDASEHYYQSAISTCVVQTGKDFKKKGKGEYRGSFSVSGLGSKSYRCSVLDGIISCTSG